MIVLKIRVIMVLKIILVCRNISGVPTFLEMNLETYRCGMQSNSVCVIHRMHLVAKEESGLKIRNGFRN